MIDVFKAMERFYEKHPNWAFAIAILCVFALLEIARQWDQSDDTAIQIQMMSTNLRSST